MTARTVPYAIASGHPKVVFTMIYAPGIANISMRTTACNRTLALGERKARDPLGQSVPFVATDRCCNN